MSESIRTTRLDLVPMTPEFLRASIDGRKENMEASLDILLPESWPDIPSILKLRLQQLEADPELQPWLLRAMRLRSTNTMIGYIGFHTKPGAAYLRDWCAEGVEFGCTVFSGYRRQGFAREASLGLMQWAREAHGVADFIVTVGRENEASRALFSRIGFTGVGLHVDEVDGIEDIFIRRFRVAT